MDQKQYVRESKWDEQCNRKLYIPIKDTSPFYWGEEKDREGEKGTAMQLLFTTYQGLLSFWNNEVRRKEFFPPIPIGLKDSGSFIQTPV